MKKGEEDTLAVPTSDNYTQLGKRFAEEFLSYCVAGEESGWMPCKTIDDVKIWKKTNPKGTGLDLMKGTLKFDLPPESVWKSLIDPEHLKYVDQYYMKSEECERYDEEHAIVHYCYKFPFPLSNRDFLCLEVYQNVEETRWIAIATSVEAPHKPPTRSFVRGNLRVSGYLIESVLDNPDACIVTSLMECDPCGSVPKFLINRDAVTQPAVLAKIKKYLEKGEKTYGK